MRFPKRKEAAAAAFTATALGLAAGVSSAAVISGGSGDGRPRAVTAQEVTVDAFTGAADLYPGNTHGDIHFTLTNDNPYPVTFTDMEAGTVTSSDPVKCPASNVDVEDVADLALSVASSSTSPTRTIDDVVSMDAGAPDGCQGVSFDIALVLRGSSA